MNLSRVAGVIGVVTVFSLTACFYHWVVGAPKLFTGQQVDYYNLLVDGYQAGQLAMKVEVEPTAPGERPRPFLQDASLHHGKYYLYFGSVPALLLLWPWTAITGHDLSEGMAIVFLALVALGLAAGWLRTLCRHFLPPVGLGWWLAALVIMATASAYPVVLRRPSFYEIAILSGTVCSLAGLWSLTLAWLREGKELRWLALGSLCAGLAAGSRPTLIPGAVLAVGVMAILVVLRDKRAGRITIRRILAGTAATVLPVSACLAAIAWHNWVRFGSPFDFGLLHQQGANANGFPFTLGFLWKNTLLYYFTLPDLSWYFPFFSAGVKPLGSYQEEIHGQACLLPLLALAAAWVGWRWRRAPQTEAARLRAILLVAAIWTGLSYVVVAMAWAHANRYMLDFHPAIVVVALFGLLGCATAGKRSWRLAAWAGLGVGAFAAVFNIFINFQVHGFFRGTHPEAHVRLAAAWNARVWPLHRLTDPVMGGVELAVRFPDGRIGTLEPLLVAGGGAEKDAILIHYTAPGRGRIIYGHQGLASVDGTEFDLHPGRVRWLKIHLGSLYPPAGHPWYRDQPPGMERARQRVAVSIDGQSVLDRDTLCYQADSSQVVLGRQAGYHLCAERFGGTIDWVRGLGADAAWLERMRDARGSVRLRLQLPRDRFGVIEPVLLTGAPGKMDIVVVHYLAEGWVRFGLLHQGWSEVRWSDRLAWDYQRPAELLVASSALSRDVTGPLGEERGVSLDFGGKIVLREKFSTHPADAIQLYLGCAPRTLGFARDTFGGNILSVTREREDLAPLRRAQHGLLAGHEIELRLERPPQAAELGEPVLTTGFTGRGDGIYLNYLPDNMATIGFDHWGSQPVRSQPFRLGRDPVHRVRISFGPCPAGLELWRNRVRVWVDDQPVIDAEMDLFSCKPEQIAFGENPIGMSTSRPVFSGRLMGLGVVGAEAP